MASSKLFDDVALISDTLATDIPAPFCERFAALAHSLRRPSPFNAIDLSETLSVLFWAFELVADLKRGRRTPGKSATSSFFQAPDFRPRHAVVGGGQGHHAVLRHRQAGR